MCETRYRDLAAQCTDDCFCDRMRTRLHGHFIKESQGRGIMITSAEYPMVGTVLTHGYGLCPYNKVESEAHVLLVHHDGRLGRTLSEHASAALVRKPCHWWWLHRRVRLSSDGILKSPFAIAKDNEYQYVAKNAKFTLSGTRILIVE